MKFDWTFHGTSRFDELWAIISHSHLDAKSTHEKKFGVQTLSSLACFKGINWKLFKFDFSSLRIWLTP
jgi:hypothetical protein